MTRFARIRTLLYGLSLSVVAAGVACSGDDDNNNPPVNNNNTANNNNNTANNNDAPTVVQLATDAGLTDLVAAVTTAGLADALTNTATLTVFAPTNAAFAALGGGAPTDPELLANVLLHHVVGGEALDSTAVTNDGPFTTLAKTTLVVETVNSTITVGGATLSMTVDQMVRNGIVHVMDEVIVPPNVLQAAAATADLSTLVEAVEAASEVVADTLGGAGPITVFAPTNAAFAASGIDLDNIDVADLDSVLTYHVVMGQSTSDELTDGQTITTVNGATLTVNVSTAAVTLTDLAGMTSTVTTADIRLLNGVVHIIDGVLDPTAP